MTRVLYGRTEGVVSAPDANYMVRGAIAEALRCKRKDKDKDKVEAILFDRSGHGHVGTALYPQRFAGQLSDDRYEEAELAMTRAGLLGVPEPV